MSRTDKDQARDKECDQPIRNSAENLDDDAEDSFRGTQNYCPLNQRHFGKGKFLRDPAAG